MMIAAEYEAASAMNILIEKKANLNFADLSGCTALHIASRLGNIDACKVSICYHV